ncbi:MAG: inosine-5-monophosphate dehydrogenase [Parvularcula sp.]|uniref:CBS domain-containing protein n=1 Tax=Hyphococcus sp. TaxID=2038636 RepID=UPI000C4DF9A1|nr:inosine-5-monophosphate dehydrogenase [Parvularcula sp.]
MKIREAMSPDCLTCGPGDSIATAGQLMARENFGSVPVAEDNRLVGMLTDRDIVIRGVANGCDATTMTVGELMSDKLYYCYDDQDVEEVADNMGDMQVRRLPVVDRNKKLVGIVSLGDLATEGPRTNAAGDALTDISRPAA